MSSLKGTPELLREELLPLTRELCRLAEAEGDERQLAFFEGICAALEHVREPDDLAGPFMELSTSAFRGFDFSPTSMLVLDHALAVAQSLSMTLSAPSGDVH